MDENEALLFTFPKPKPRKKPKRTKCEAWRKYDGLPCQAKALANGRCKLHGGMSTGPKTDEGKARIAEAMKARWREQSISK